MNDDLVNLDRLRAWLSYERRDAVIRWLDENGVRYRRGKNGDPVTTLAAINAAMLGDAAPPREFF